MKLSELKEGESGIIVKVTGHGGFRKRIVEMGFISGQKVEVLINAPLKDPVKYRIMGYEVSLRHSEAEMIEVVGIDESDTLNSQPSSYQAGVPCECKNDSQSVTDEQLHAIAIKKKKKKISIRNEIIRIKRRRIRNHCQSHRPWRFQETHR